MADSMARLKLLFSLAGNLHDKLPMASFDGSLIMHCHGASTKEGLLQQLGQETGEPADSLRLWVLATSNAGDAPAAQAQAQQQPAAATAAQPQTTPAVAQPAAAMMPPTAAQVVAVIKACNIAHQAACTAQTARQGAEVAAPYCIPSKAGMGGSTRCHASTPLQHSHN